MISMRPALSSVLIANRGEIACRVITTARRLGMRAIAVYSEADARARHVALADEAHLIGPAPARESYLVVERLIEVAKRAGAAAIHPGYGFLSERAEFAEACAAAGIVFVGPPPGAIRAMGLKGDAKALMQRANVPVVPGYHGERQEPDFLREKAYEIGYPVLIKAVAGGGGKGMKRVDRVIDFEDALASAVREATNAFGDGRVLVEKYVKEPRHVEIQVFADAHGNAVSLFERDCSLQRRHQKVIEEAPAPGMTDAVRAKMGAAAVAAAKAVGYVGAGTVEFIADGSRGLREDGFYFMEMNTRLQVEHPVTEAVTGLDLVELQFHVAAGGKLPFAQGDLAISGHAVEARVYAEDPETGFLPSTGLVESLRFPDAAAFTRADHGVRVDAGVTESAVVSPFYDPMIGKVIAHGATRDEALDRLSAALGATTITGPKTNLAFLKALADHPDFRAGRFDTGFIDQRLEALGATRRPPSDAMIAAGVASLISARAAPADGWRSPFAAADGFQLSGPRRLTQDLLADGEPMTATLVWDHRRGPGPTIEVDGRVLPPPAGTPRAVAGQARVFEAGRQVTFAFPDPAERLASDGEGGDGVVKAPMHGKLVALFVTPGQIVAKGDKVLVVEAMKMEHAMAAPLAGTIAEVRAEVGEQVGQGAVLVTIHPPEAA
jgi:3-methylcrotonyl-CoA carboxylase alpha subunit